MYIRKCLSVVLFVLAAVPTISFADARIRVESKINGKPVVFAFDTGAEKSILFKRSAEKLGLAISKNPAGSGVENDGRVRPFGITESCEFDLHGKTYTSRFPVIAFPGALPMDVDGVLAWSDARANLLYLRVGGLNMSTLEALPDDIENWDSFPIRKDMDVLIFDAKPADGATQSIFLDTGSPRGVALSAKRWAEWSAAHPKAPRTLNAGFSAAAGLVVNELSWASSLSIGKYQVKSVPVEKLEVGPVDWLGSVEAMFGLFVLTRHDVIIDGANNTLYLKDAQGKAVDYPYNRLGAIFAPKTMRADHLVAHVVKNSPAYKVGIREGDVLLRINDLDTTKWKTDPRILPLYRFWSQKAGTKFLLKVGRGTETLTVTVTLEELFGQN